MADWDENSPQLHENLAAVLGEALAQARRRDAPSVELARSWQQTIMHRLDVPDVKYVGRFRGEPGLEHCQVRVGAKPGVQPSQVAAELGRFEQTLRRATEMLDRAIIGGPTNREQLTSVIELCAWVHAEWVRIHPFANGNGRTARLWANFVAMRYGLPAFVGMRPRPGDDYARASNAAMDGKWQPMIAVFADLYKKSVRRQN